MARTSPRERPDRDTVLWPIQKLCPACGSPMRVRYENQRTLVTLAALSRHIRKNESYVHQFVYRGTPKKSRLAKLAVRGALW